MRCFNGYRHGSKFRYSTDAIAKALASFKGIRRQFSYQIKTDNLVYIDDYAHHPTNYAVYQAVRELYPDKKFLPCFSLIYSAEQRFC
jgi:UDP-N-acetylmuramate--alanine ligase